MNRRQFAWTVVGIGLLVASSASQAQAGQLRFGTDETIHTIQPTKDKQYELCYKTSIYFFIAGCYVTDDGYVLRKAGDRSQYFPLTPDAIKELQEEGELPNPLPPYSLSFFDYLFGYSNWIILGVFIAIPTIKWAWRKITPKPADSTLPEEPSGEPESPALKSETPLSTVSGGAPITLEQLGALQREFKPGLENLVAGIILGLLLIGGGCAAVSFSIYRTVDCGGNVPIWTEKGQPGWCWGTAVMIAAVGLGLVVGGIWLIRWIRSLFSFRLHFFQNGFVVTDKQTVRMIGWDDIVSVQETHLYERPPLLKGPAKYVLPQTMSKSFTLSLRAGDPFGFDGNTIKGHGKLAKMIKEETDRRNVPWAIVDEYGY